MTRQARHGLLAAAAFAAGLAAGPARAQTPVDACTTITDPGSYILTGNITASRNCIVVDADHVSLDLNGFAIIGDGTGIGIAGDSTTPRREGATVRNGTVANFGTGINLERTPRSKLKDLRVLNNVGNAVVLSTDSIVGHSISAGNGRFGLGTPFGDTLILGNISRGNRTGITMRSGGSLITPMIGNVVHANSINGALLTVAALVTGNAIHGNGHRGIEFSIVGAGRFTVTNNAVTENAGGLDLAVNDGRLDPDDGALVINNAIRSNLPDGNQVGTCSNCTIPPSHNRF